MAECPGIYRLSLMRDGALGRIRVPGGMLSAAHLRAVSRVANTFGNGLIDLTNRANLQIRGLSPDAAPRIAEHLRAADLLCDDPDVDRARNITASPLAGLDPDELTDTRPYVSAIDAVIQSSAACRTLSPKFACMIDGGGQVSLRDIAHDIGFLAITPERFAISLAGRATGVDLPPNALAPFFDRLVTRLAADAAMRVRDAALTASELGELTAGLGATRHNWQADLDTRPRFLQPGPGHDGSTQEAGSRRWFTAGIPLARFTAAQLASLADLADASDASDRKVRLTPWHSVVLEGDDAAHVAEIRAKAADLGLDTEPRNIHVIACAGATGCDRTSADTKADGARLRDALAHVRPDAAPFAEPTRIHLSGCPRGCAAPHASDILALAQPGRANYALHAGSRPSHAAEITPLVDDVTPEALAASIGAMLGRRS